MNKLTKNRSRLIWMLLLVLVVPLSWYCKQPDTAVGLNDEKTGKIYGKVTDAETGKPLAGANIIIMNTNKGVASDMNGNYVISGVPAGNQDIVCSVIGYSRTFNMDIKVASNKSTKVNFKLKPEAIQGELITVTPNTSIEAPPPPPATPVKFDTAPKPIDGYEAISKAVKYPESARKAGLEGKVLVSIYIDENGNVTGHEIKETMSAISNSFVPDTKAITDCGDAAVYALSSLKWIPAMKDDHPVGVWVTVPVTFRLPDKQGAWQFKVEGEKTPVEFIAYDTPPFPIGGQAALAKNVQYPELAKKAGIEGTVIVQAKIALDGTVEEAIILRGLPNTGFDNAALDAVKSTKWVPAKQRDKDVSVLITIPVLFKLDDKE